MNTDNIAYADRIAAQRAHMPDGVLERVFLACEEALWAAEWARLGMTWRYSDWMLGRMVPAVKL